nr:VCBS repeat-containing protein [Kribbella sp. NBC_01245]
MVLANGDVKAWRNGRGFTDMPWDADTIVGSGFSTENLHYADLNADGRKEIIAVLPNGDLKAWRNDRGFAPMPWGDNVIIGSGFSPNNTFFADLNADGRSEVLMVMPNGDLKAWRNGRGFAAMPWDADVIIGTGFSASNIFLADLNADGKAEAMTVLPNGDVKAWRNARGFAAMPWDADAIIATGFTANNLFLPDLDGDGKADITTVLANGDVKSWHNGAGFAATPWNATAIVASGFSPTNLFFA